MSTLLAYLFYFVAASASPLQRRALAKKYHDSGARSQIRFAFQTALIVGTLGLALPFFQPFAITGSPFELVPLCLCAGFFGAGCFVASYTAQKKVESSVSTIVTNIYTPVTIVLASLLLHESLTPPQICGTILLLVSMVIISKKHKIGRFGFDRYFWMMLSAGVMLGISITAERALQKISGFTAGTLMSWWSQVLFLGIATLIWRAKNTYSLKEIGITGLLRFLQSLSWVVLIFIVGNLSVVSAVTTFKVVIIFLAAALILGERDDLLRKSIGSIIAMVGLFLMK